MDQVCLYVRDLFACMFFGSCLYVRGITCFGLGNENCSFQIRYCHIMKKWCPACGRKMSSITKRLIHFLSRNGIFTKKKKQLVNLSSVNLPVVFPFLQKPLAYYSLVLICIHKHCSFARISLSLTARKQIRIELIKSFLDRNKHPRKTFVSSIYTNFFPKFYNMVFNVVFKRYI